MPHQASRHLEKRRHLRVEYNIPVKISGDHGDILTETRNLSCSGAFCRITQRLEPMTKLKVHLLLPLRKSDKVGAGFKPAPTKKITCEGVVVRTQAVGGQEHYDTAIFFSDITPKDSRTINEFVVEATRRVASTEKNYGKFN